MHAYYTWHAHISNHLIAYCCYTPIADLAFTAIQFIAVVCASIPMVVLTIAPFRPAGRARCSAKSLVKANGGLMIGFIIFQTLTFSLAIGIRHDLLDSYQVCFCIAILW